MTTPYDAAVLADSPNLYWKLDETSGTSAADSSGNSRTGTIVGSPTLAVPGPGLWLPTAMNFDGVNDRVSRAYDAAHEPSSFTYEGWVYYTGAFFALFSVDDLAGATSLTTRQGDSPVHAIITVLNTVGGTHFAKYNDTALTTSTWYHLAVTWDGTTIKWYLNGVADGSATPSPSGTRRFGTYQLNAGLDSNGYTAGRLAGVAIYPSVLSAARLLAHYQALTAVSQTHQMLV